MRSARIKTFHDLTKPAMGAWSAGRNLLYKPVTLRLRGIGRCIPEVEQFAEMVCVKRFIAGLVKANRRAAVEISSDGQASRLCAFNDFSHELFSAHTNLQIEEIVA